MAEDSALVERGVLTADEARWELAARRAGVIGRLAQQDRVGVAAADEAAAELGVSRRQVYVLMELDAATQTAPVDGLRAFGYSWGEIATRISTTHQASSAGDVDPAAFVASPLRA